MDDLGGFPPIFGNTHMLMGVEDDRFTGDCEGEEWILFAEWTLCPFNQVVASIW